MQLDELKTKLAGPLADDLDSLHEQWSKQAAGSTNIDDFVAWLYGRRLINDTALNDIVGGDTVRFGTLAQKAGRSPAGGMTLLPDDELDEPDASPHAASATLLPDDLDEDEGDPTAIASNAELAELRAQAEERKASPAPAPTRDAAKASGARSGARPKTRDEAKASGARSGARPKTRDAAKASGARSGARPKTRDAAKASGARSGARPTSRSTAGTTAPSEGRRRGARNQGPASLAGRGYDFVGQVGAGAMGEVLRANDLSLRRTVAYKVMSPEIAQQPALASKFSGEAQITAQLEHPNIVPIYALEASRDGTLAYTMKLVKGKTIEDYIDVAKEAWEKGQQPDEDHGLEAMLDNFIKVCDAMHYAHLRGVVHRDLKPENIMIGAYGEVYVMDWGIARLINGAAPPSGEELVSLDFPPEDEGELIIGTPQYMSPEQANGDNDQLTGASDQYALGLILFEICSLKPAVTGKSPLAIAMRQQDAEKDPLVHIKGETIPTELQAIIHKATAKTVHDRYESVKALGEDIRRYKRGEAVHAKPDTTWQATLRWVAKHRELTLLGVVSGFVLAFLVVVGGGALVLYQSAQAEQREQRLSELLTTTGAQASTIDGQFLKYQGMLGIVAASAAEMLLVEPPAEPPKLFFSKDFDGENAPPDLDKAEKYGGIALSYTWPVNDIAEKGDQELATRQLQQLHSLGRIMRREQLRSQSEEAALMNLSRLGRRIGSQGVPLTWVMLGLESGGFVEYPGHGGRPDGFDPRERPWYKLAAGERGPRCGAPHIDVSEQGYVLPCAVSLFDDQDNLLGVAAVDVSFDYIIEELLVPDELSMAEETYLVNKKGEIMVASSKAGVEVSSGGRIRNNTIRMSEFPQPEVLQGIQNLQSSFVEYRDGSKEYLVFYNRLGASGWYYVVKGESQKMLSGG